MRVFSDQRPWCSPRFGYDVAAIEEGTFFKNIHAPVCSAVHAVTGGVWMDTKWRDLYR